MNQPTIGRIKRLGEDDVDTQNAAATAVLEVADDSVSIEVEVEVEVPVVAPVKKVEEVEKPVQSVQKKTPPQRPKLRLKGKDYSEEDKKVVGEACPSCGKGLEDEAVLCLHCGFNVKTGKKTKVTKSADPKFSAVAKGKELPKQGVDILGKLKTLLMVVVAIGGIAFALVYFDVITSGPVKNLVDDVVVKVNELTGKTSNDVDEESTESE
ncbi:MAG: zinc ribbon domain-containing protein [Lentisphaeraceae bacterium]|nr:zinc ribbon domain-containing protein [Lentisphaeraceae bacterium]